MPSWVCQWKPFWIPVGESFRKAFVEDWVFVSGDSSYGQNVMDFPFLHSTDHSDCIPETPRISKQVDSLPWEPMRPQDKAYFWERMRHHCLRYGHGHNAISFIHDNSVPYLSVWNCHFQMMKSYPVTKKLSPQEQITLLRASR